MSRAVSAAPTRSSGFTQFTVRDATVVARADAAEGIRAALHDTRTLHGWAATQPGAKRFQGRDAAWGVRLPQSSLDVVVRHARHGGLLAPLTGDRFFWPSRAPWELHVSERLRAGGVPTPAFIAYVLYPAGPFWCRCDVATALLPEGGDLPALWTTSDAATRRALLAATAQLLRRLGAMDARHPDINAKNVYLARSADGWTAYALDVDVLRFDPELHQRDTAMTANLARLVRSLRKCRDTQGLAISDDDIAELTRLAGTP